MTKPSVYVACLLAMSATACAELEAPEGAAGGAADDVALVTEELGAWSHRYTSEVAGPASLSSDYMVVPESGNCSRQVDVAWTQLGTPLNTPLIPNLAGCETITAVWGGNGEVLVADTVNGRIYRLMADAGFNLFWHEVTTTTPFAFIFQIRHTGTHVVWQDPAGIHRVRLSDGSGYRLLAGPGTGLIEVDGSNLYVQIQNPDDTFTLQRLPTNGAAPTAIATRSYSFASSFAFNSTHIYFNNYNASSNWNRIYKMQKSGAGLVGFVSIPFESNQEILGIEASETHVYWWQKSDGRIHRKKISDGATSDVSCPGALDFCQHIVLAPDALYTIGHTAGENPALWRGQR